MSASVQMECCQKDILLKSLENNMSVSDRCNNAGPMAKTIPTSPFAAFVLSCLQVSMSRLRW
ncbi:hypothetical protein C7C56_022055 [Massilia glaciei]|uniref:Uncharacterized protein n=1 Tax=Massilia glaciei TaxID=1524097 RepID=A0A2U2HFC4_9BURK|nr:hypothetical protein C7C56_022055 [Massilia glaciei]